MRDYNQLAQAVETALVNFEQLLEMEVFAAEAALPAVRMRLVQTVNAYISNLSQMLATPTIGQSAKEEVQIWQREYARLLEFRREYSKHIAQWDARSVGTGWHDYKLSSRALVRAMRAHLNHAASFPVL